MKMLRGASVFLILVFVAVFVECKKEASVGNTETTATTETSTSGSMAAITLTHNLCMPAGKHVCPNDPCVIEVKVKDNDNSVHAEKVWLYEGQKIRWTPKPDHHPAPGDPEPKV